MANSREEQNELQSKHFIHLITLRNIYNCIKISSLEIFQPKFELVNKEGNLEKSLIIELDLNESLFIWLTLKFISP